ncbi:MAG: pyridoxal-dependent decarboxylase [Pseudomonadota bacterium]
MTQEGQHLDPEDWGAFAQDMHALLDACLARMMGARDLPWQPVPEDFADQVAISGAPESAARIMEQMTGPIMAQATGNTHPRFWGWVHGTGLPIGVAAEMVAATMNSNTGGRWHGAAEVERAVLRWLCGEAGWGENASGILTGGTSQATLLALTTARQNCFGSEIRAKGLAGLPPVRVYMAEGGHSCVDKALEIMGHGTDSLTLLPLTDRYQMDTWALRDAIARDRAAGRLPLAIVGTAGSVGIGAYDDLEALAEIAATEKIWFHVDAAFGFWSRLAAPPWGDLARGIETANSIGLDLHKWIGVPYACGACLMADAELHRATFTHRPDYLAQGEDGLAGGDLWFCDYGIDLSRGFTALKVWASLASHGREAFGHAITDNCRQAELMGQLVERQPGWVLAAPVISNICCFHIPGQDHDALAARLHLSGAAVFSTARVNDLACLRAAIVNHRTTSQDISDALQAVQDAIATSQP